MEIAIDTFEVPLLPSLGEPFESVTFPFSRPKTSSSQVIIGSGRIRSHPGIQAFV